MTAVDNAIQLTEKATGLNFKPADIAAARAQLGAVDPAALEAYNTNVTALLQQNHNQPLSNAPTQLAAAATTALHSSFGVPANLELTAGNTVAITSALGYDVDKVNGLRHSGTAFKTIGQMIEAANKDTNYPRLAAAAPPPPAGRGPQSGTPHQPAPAQGGQPGHPRRRHGAGAAPPPPPPAADAAGGDTSGSLAGGSDADTGSNDADAGGGTGAMMSNAFQMLPGLIKKYGLGTVITAGIQTIVDYFSSRFGSGGGLSGIMSMFTGQGGSQQSSSGGQFDFMDDFTRNLTAAANGSAASNAGGAAPPPPADNGATQPSAGGADGRPPDPSPHHSHGAGRHHHLRASGTGVNGSGTTTPPPPAAAPPPPPPASTSAASTAAAAARQRHGAAP